jgi:hypothetical protein
MQDKRTLKKPVGATGDRIGEKDHGAAERSQRRS